MEQKKKTETTKKRILNTATRLFMEKGYENTRVEDILEELGDLTKGAVYHHFKSKEDLFDAVATEMGRQNRELLLEIKENDKLTGAEKLKEMIQASFRSQDTEQIMNMTPNLLENPKFLAAILKGTQEIAIPQYIAPVVEAGVKDGSIKTENPKALAELIMVLMNIWFNPLIFNHENATPLVKCQMINAILKQYNLLLFDEDMLKGMPGL